MSARCESCPEIIPEGARFCPACVLSKPRNFMSDPETPPIDWTDEFTYPGELA